MSRGLPISVTHSGPWLSSRAVVDAVMASTLKLACIIYIVVIIAPSSSLCNECSDSSMDGNLNTYNNDSDSVSVAVVIAESYCFMNECTIILEKSNVLLNIINNTGDRILAANSTTLFTVIVTNGSGVRNCSSDATKSIMLNVWLYGPPLTFNFIVLIAATATIIIHFIYRELRTVSGILIVILCISISIIECVAITYIMTFYQQVNIPKELCAVIFNYFNLVILGNIYEASKTTLLAHFAYAMFRSYKLLGDQENERSLLYKYIAFIIGAPAIIGIIIITVDVTVTRKAFETTSEGQCILFIDPSATEGVQLSLIMFYVIIIIWLILQLLFLVIGLVFYILTTKQCCGTSRDLRVTLILVATVDVTIFIALFFLIIRVSEGGRLLSIVIIFVTAAKQVTLLILFLSSSKVMCCYIKRKRNSNLSANSTT